MNFHRPACGLILILAACSPPPPEAATVVPSAPGSLAVEPAAVAEEPGLPALPAETPSTANVELYRSLIMARDATYSPADGGGSLRLLSGTDVQVREAGEWAFEYTAGDEGVAVGGKIYFQASPFWNWSHPQTEAPGAEGYTEVTTAAVGVGLRSEPLGNQCLLIHIEGRALATGETIRIVYGKGRTARADRYAEDEERFFLWVDGDGDEEGTRRLVDGDIAVTVHPRPASNFAITVPSSAAPGESFPITIAFFDAAANAAFDYEGEVKLLPVDGLELPEQVAFVAQHEGSQRVTGKVLQAGTYRLEAQAEGAVRRSNPLVVKTKPRRILWADLQGHSGLTDGTGTPENYYRYARDFAALDVVALTDHDHHGMRMLDEHPDMWQRIKDVTQRFHEPGRFVTLLGFEWTSWLFGHRHVLYFEDDGPLLSSVDPRTDTPAKLWQALAGHRAMTVAHHTAKSSLTACDWSFAPPPELETVVEIVSVHGSSEGEGAPLSVRPLLPGHTVRDALARGYRLGFIGSGDGHDGHPGMAHKNAPSGGVAALFADEHSRDAVESALRRRACYATSGPRIFMGFYLGSAPMGSEIPFREAAGQTFIGFVAGTAPLQHLDLIKNGEIYYRLEIDGSQESALLTFADPDLTAGDVVYLRAMQEDGHGAWASPVFVTGTEAGSGNETGIEKRNETER